MKVDWNKVREDAESAHICSSEPYNARTYLSTISLTKAGAAPVQPVRRQWMLRLKDDSVMVSHCPWCGVELER